MRQEPDRRVAQMWTVAKTMRQPTHPLQRLTEGSATRRKRRNADGSALPLERSWVESSEKRSAEESQECSRPRFGKVPAADHASSGRPACATCQGYVSGATEQPTLRAPASSAVARVGNFTAVAGGRASRHTSGGATWVPTARSVLRTIDSSQVCDRLDAPERAQCPYRFGSFGEPSVSRELMT